MRAQLLDGAGAHAWWKVLDESGLHVEGMQGPMAPGSARIFGFVFRHLCLPESPAWRSIALCMMRYRFSLTKALTPSPLKFSDLPSSDGLAGLIGRINFLFVDFQ
jgi:hypothetical protein